ncbi:hypothetical protein RCL_jg24399.t1 [Rhizophagus clarus]|uniref:Uncharacterized protein n=1 Tax=Rhizophagus clarus TaxID=94130 RepID=A0A8H3MGI4_9GLOM|nr:hypothetical protein RCL_jg24399.t1 [Rhizophagus clarus]
MIMNKKLIDIQIILIKNPTFSSLLLNSTYNHTSSSIPNNNNTPLPTDSSNQNALLNFFNPMLEISHNSKTLIFISSKNNIIHHAWISSHIISKVDIIEN